MNNFKNKKSNFLPTKTKGLKSKKADNTKIGTFDLGIASDWNLNIK